jgi:peptidoglycan/LPS O-acetylase OafA/YrhL
LEPSVEAVCYLIFFGLVFSYPRGFLYGCAVMIVVGGSMEVTGLKLNLPLLNFPVGQAITGFFSGCVVGQVYQSRYMLYLRWAALGILIAFATRAIEFGSIFGARFYWTFDAVLFPSLLLCAVGFAPLRCILEIRPLLFLGRISYSIYLCRQHVKLSGLCSTSFDRFFGC